MLANRGEDDDAIAQLKRALDAGVTLQSIAGDPALKRLVARLK